MIKLSDIMENPKLMESLVKRCPICKCQLNHEETMQTSYGEICEDCYFEDLGKIIEGESQ